MFHRLRGHVHSKASRLILQQFVESRCRMYPKVINEFYWKGNKAVSLTYIDISLFLQILSLFLEILYYRYQYWVLKKKMATSKFRTISNLLLINYWFWDSLKRVNNRWRCFNACKNTMAQVKNQCLFIIFCVKLNEKISTHLNLIRKPTDLPWFDVTSSWMLKMCLIFVIGQNVSTI